MKSNSYSNAPVMPRERGIVLSAVIGIVGWIAGILVSLAVGFGMVDGVLSIRYIPNIVTAIAGWILIGLTLLGAILAIIYKARGK